MTATETEGERAVALACPGLSHSTEWDQESVLRGDIYTTERLIPHAVEVARAVGQASLDVPAGRLLGRIAEARKRITAAYEALSKDVRARHRPSSSEEWLLDNSHIVNDQLREIEEDLPEGYLTKLPRLVSGKMRGYPRVYALCIDYLRHTDARLDTDGLVQYVAAYQQANPLSIGELWAIPILLRLGLILVTGAIASAAADALTRGGDSRDGAAEAVRSRRDHVRQAADQVTVANAITSMRTIAAFDWNKFFDRTSLVEAILARDPGAVYAGSDEDTRDRCRHAIEELAEHSAADERAVATAALRLAEASSRDAPAEPWASHVGHYLVGDGRQKLEESVGYRPTVSERAARHVLKRPGIVYFGAIAAISGITWGAWTLGAFHVAPKALAAAFSLLALLPASELAIAVVNALLVSIVRPRVLSKLSLRSGVGAERRTLVVVPALLENEQVVDELLSRLEVHALGNQDDHVHFALLTDLPDSVHATTEDLDPLVARARAGIADLNARHAGPDGNLFMLCHRRRKWNPSEGVYMGWERKRGKLAELNRLLRGEETTSYSVVTAPMKLLRSVRYVITLDADTELPRGVAKKLIGTLSHPENRIRKNAAGQVIGGYGLVQPRVRALPGSSRRSKFARISAGPPGIDAYTNAVSDVYQDVFGAASYVGKAIYDVDAFREALDGRVPENRLLSHDLFEGIFVRTALASDIEVLDDQPSSYAVVAARHHRWIRGDFQLLPWLFPRVPTASGERRASDLPGLGWWKLFDNLRRALVPICLILLVALGWSGESTAWFVTATLIALLTAPLYGRAAVSIFRAPKKSPHSLRPILADLRNGAAQIFLDAIFLFDQALLAADAVVRTAYRMLVSKRHLLEWQTSGQAERRFSGRLPVRMWVSAALAVAGGAALFVVAPRAMPFAVPFLAFWISAPVSAVLLSRPERRRLAAGLSRDDRTYLRRLAFETWRFFDTFVTEQEHFLPPDNYQEDPLGVVAHRTSPTNIGIYLLSVVAARDLGFITLREVIDRLNATLSTVERLEKYEGHVLNWYDTTTLKPLEPRYVSTVDSGNLAAYLWTIRRACIDFERGPFSSSATIGAASAAFSLAGDEGEGRKTVDPDLERRLAEGVGTDAGNLFELIRFLDDAANRLDEVAKERKSSNEGGRAQQYWLERAWLGVAQAAVELRGLAPWAELPSKAPAVFGDVRLAEPWMRIRGALHDVHSIADVVESAAELAALVDALEERVASTSDLTPEQRTEALGFSADLREKVAASLATCVSIRNELRKIGSRAQALADAMNFGFLYDKDRLLFSIGYNAQSERPDGSYYDLLASESRLASFLAVAKGDVREKHWFRLGRSLTSLRAGRALWSWTGSTFEYLMPLLVMRDGDETLLHETYVSVVDAQRRYGEQKGIPWGMSESLFNLMDLSLTYQYRAFGVPGLGLKQGLEEDLVVAPYATALASMVRPDLAVQNLRALEREGLRGPYGMFEAIDYTPSRVPRGRRGVVVKAFMAHHQGMTLVALDNALGRGRVQRRFHDDPRVRATELLLEERAPVTMPLAELRPAPALKPGVDELEPDVVEHADLDFGVVLRAHQLGGEDMSSLVTSVGTGVTLFQGLDVNRFREDATLRGGGIFVYVRDLRTGQVWSAGYEPTRRAPDTYDAAFSSHAVEIRRRDGDIETVLDVVVSPEAPAEVRRITLTNHGEARRDLEITTFTEIVLEPRNADRAHRAFGGLFVETEALVERGAVLAHRRPRSLEELGAWVGQTLTPEEGVWTNVDYDGSRATFIGRGRDVSRPAALVGAARLSKTLGAVLDPALALRRTVSLKAGKSARVALATVLGPDRSMVEHLIEQYSDPAAVVRAFELSRIDARAELRQLGLTAEESGSAQRLLSSLVFANPRLRAGGELRIEGARGRGALYALGLSGDSPIMVLRLDDPEFSEVTESVLRAHEFLRTRGFPFDLVLLNEEPSGYFHPREDHARELVRASIAHNSLDRKGGVTIRRADQMSDADKALLLRAAHVVLHASKGSLSLQLRRATERTVSPSRFSPVRTLVPEARAETMPIALDFDNGVGGFARGSSEYVVRVTAGRRPGAPWCNVVANEAFGFVVSEAGASFTWSTNSQSRRLTPWSNDPVCDPSGELFFVRDDENGAVWSVTPAPAGGAGRYTVRHGFGFTAFEHQRDDLEHEFTMFVDRTRPAKIYRLVIENRGVRRRTLLVLGAVEWVLGNAHDRSCLTVSTEWDRATSGIFAMNQLGPHVERCAFFKATSPVKSFTADRTELYGRSGSRERPRALRRVALSGRTGAGLDPCAALEVALHLSPGERAEISFVLGDAAGRREAQELAKAFDEPGAVAQSFEEVSEHWRGLLGAVTVRTPDAAFDRLVNGWLLYQVVSCRLLGRTSFYQPSGAFGFRDQLQDVLALVHARPDLVREHLLRAASRQFSEGDVQHWWHPDTGEGIRTRCSDDMLWLPFVASEYVRATGDMDVLDQGVPFLDAKPLAPGETDSFGAPDVSTESAPLYEHCVRAIRVAITRGPHGLPKMRGGDWNDGMNRVGGGDGGESVWLAWFLARVLADFAEVANARGDRDRAAEWLAEASRIGRAVDAAAWDGNWYLRGYFDDGHPLGSSANEDCRIDAIAQSWAVLSGFADERRAERALDSSEALLVDENDALMSLLWPPFQLAEHDPGYIRAYPEGVRENGGQYTHGVLWTVLARTKLGQGDRAFSLFSLLNPIHHGSSETAPRYAVEPYVVAGDVRAGGPWSGCGGWTWYTGAAGWMYRIALENILGVRREGPFLRIQPCVPRHFIRYEVDYKYGTATYHVTFENRGGAAGRVGVSVDGRQVDGTRVPLVSDGLQHEVRVILTPLPSVPASSVGGPAPKGTNFHRTTTSPEGAAQRPEDGT